LGLIKVVKKWFTESEVALSQPPAIAGGHAPITDVEIITDASWRVDE